MDFGTRLKELRERNHMTQEELARKTGFTTVTVSNWEHGIKSPNMSSLISLCRALSVSSDELLGIYLNNKSGKAGIINLNADERDLIVNYRSLDIHGRNAVSTLCRLEYHRIVDEKARKRAEERQARILRFSDARLIRRYYTPSAAGVSAPIDGADYEMILEPDDLTERPDYAVVIQGHSMEPYIHDGDTVYVKKDTELSIGDIGIFSVDGAMYCKQYYIAKNGDLILASANPDLKHTNVRVSPDGNQLVQICGKVIMKNRIPVPEYVVNE